MRKSKIKNQKYFNNVRIVSRGAAQILFFVFIVGAGFLMHASVASAARIYMVRQSGGVGVGDTFSESLMLDPQGVSVNAVQAIVTFSSNLVLLSVSDADSIIGEWIERDATTTANTLRALSLAGIMPGGYNGTLSAYWSGARAGKIVTLVFRAADAGNAAVGIADPSVLANDGQGTPVAVDVAGDLFTVMAQPAPMSEGQQPKFAPVDVVPPDSFVPLVASSPALFGGKYFVSFSTRDNASGIVGYQVAENPALVAPADYQSALTWRNAASPYVLSDQTLRSYVYVKAIDGAGNYRVAVIPPSPVAPGVSPWRLLIIAAEILFACAIGWCILYWYHRKRYAIR